jgi:hypothetical protein
MRTLSLLLFSLSALSVPAFAGSSSDAMAELQEAEALPEIQETGITAFDSVFMKAKAIHDTLDKVQGAIIGAQDELAVAVGLEEGTPIRLTMWELKQRAGGPIEVQMKDGKPYLTLGGTGSDEVKGMVAAVNQGAAKLATIPGELAGLPAEVQQLVAACQAFPSQLNPQLLKEAGMNPLQLPKVAKTLAGNIKAVTATPKRLDVLGTAAKDLLTGIPQGIAATEPPLEAAKLAKGGATDDEDLDDLDDLELDDEEDGVAQIDDEEDLDDLDEDLDDLDEDLDEEELDEEEDLDAPAKVEAVKAVRATKATRSTSSSDSSDEGSDEDEDYESPIAGLVRTAYSAFQEAEVEHAMEVLAQAEGALGKLTWPIATTDLLNLYQTAAVMHLVDNNATAATAATTQALVMDPWSKPVSNLGPDYAKLHKALLKSGVIRFVKVDLDGEGVGYISGRRVEGGERVELPAGKHLLQVQKGGKWTSELVWIAEGVSFEIP